MPDADARRQEIAALLAERRGLDAGDRRTLDAAVEETLETFDPAAPEPTDPGEARLHRLVAAYRELRADEDNARLAEQGEVFAPEDDA